MFKFISRLIQNSPVKILSNHLPQPSSIVNKQFTSSLPLLNHVVANNKIENSSEVSKTETKSIFQNVNTLLKQEAGRLFAVVHICGKQFKITSGDIILVEGYWPPTNGDRISLDKVLLAGSNDFTLVGRPILEPGVCDVQATIIEKTLSHTKTHFKKKRRKQYQRINFQRQPHTMIRINSITIEPNINERSRETNNFRVF